MKQRPGFILLQTILICLLFSVSSQASTPTHGPDFTGAKTLQDSVQILRKHYRSRSTAEKIASFPGRLIYIPLRYTTKTLSWTVAYVDETRLIQRVEDIITSEDGLKGLEPTYASRTGAGITAYWKKFATPQSEVNMTVSAGQFFRQRYRIQAEDIELLRSKLLLDLSLNYHMYPNERFYGVGANSEKSGLSLYSIEQSKFSGAFSFQINKYSKLGIKPEYEVSNVMESPDTAHPTMVEMYTNIPGMTVKSKLVSVGFELGVDTRDHPGRTTSGKTMDISYGFYKNLGDTRYNFQKANIDLTHTQHIIHRRTLVLRIAGEMTREYDNGTIPFYYLSELGSTETIRGFERGRLRDRDMMLVSAEYRYPVWRNWERAGADFFLFMDAGQVSHDLYSSKGLLENSSFFKDFRQGFGFGLRVWNEDDLLFRTMAGWSKDGWRLYLTLN
ncbi:BamA/TamA family outer membrane protein [bacterium]|nr:BamA/TamA family outer membrane protein [bacterium]